MFYESVLQEPIQEYHLKVKREVVLKGTLHKKGVCVCMCVVCACACETLSFHACTPCVQIPRAAGVAGHSFSTLTAAYSTARKAR